MPEKSISQAAQTPFQVLHNHVRPAVSSGQAALVGSLPSTQQLNLSIMLPLRNEAALDALLGQLNDPSSPTYHQFLNVAQFTEQFGPTVEDYQAVVQFAQANGFTVTDNPPNRLIVPIQGTAAQIETAFNVKMNLYQHPTEDRTFYSPDREPSLALSVPVAHIAGLNNYSSAHSAATAISAAQAIAAGAYTGSGPGGAYLGSDMRNAYYGGTSLTGAGQVVGIFEEGGYNLSDVNESFSNTGQKYSVPINNVLVDGAGAGPSNCNNNTVDDSEQVLDIVAAIGMAPGLSQVRVYIGPCLDDVDIFNRMAYENSANQISNSWAWEPDDPGTDDPIFYEMALQGQSIFTASGDWGSYPIVDPSERYYFPEEDAWVTAVGGTVLPAYSAPWPEIAWGNGTCNGFCASGGGISPDGINMSQWATKYQLSDYQAGVANSFNSGSSTLRNVPDVAAMSFPGIYICPMGKCESWGGTSLATPLWAGYAALANQQAVAAGKSTLGFLNPAIYAIGKSSSYGNDFHDITSGSNGAFSAGAGYDLVTGWGSPNGQNLINDLVLPEPLLAAMPYESNVNVTIVGNPPGAVSVTYAMTVQDTTPNATIHYQILVNGVIVANSTISPGGTIYYTGSGYQTPYGTLYATAPGYAQSSTTSLGF